MAGLHSWPQSMYPLFATCYFVHFRQLANWLEFYAEALDLNAWTSSIVSDASPNSSNIKWTATTKRSDGREQVFREVKHLAFATGEGIIDDPEELADFEICVDSGMYVHISLRIE